MVYVDPFDRRIERAETWIDGAHKQQDDPDAQIIFFWIAFNALYGVEPLAPITDAPKATKQFEMFFVHLLKCDKDEAIQREVWDELADPICRLMRNHFVFSPFWKYQYGTIKRDAAWRRQFNEANRKFWNAWWEKNVLQVLMGIFERLYVLRNQLMHGGARWQSGRNGPQVRDGLAILLALVPILVKVMKSCEREGWGELAFPPIDDPNEFDTEECSPPLPSP